MRVFHILLHVFEILMLWLCIGLAAYVAKDYEAIKSWVEFLLGIDLYKLKEKIDKFNKENE